MNDHKRIDAQENQNEYGRSGFYYRYLIIGVFFAVMCLVYIVSAFKIQNMYGGQDGGEGDGYTTRTEVVQAMRGEIYDRNGNIVVSNNYNYMLIYDYSAMAKNASEQNEDILAILSILEGTEFRAEKQCPFKGIYPDITFDVLVLKDATVKARLARILKDHGLPENAPADDIARSIAERYGMLKNGEPIYSAEQMSELVRVRYEMEAIQFSAIEPYVFGEELDMAAITAVRELGIRGSDLKVNYTRKYHYPGYASHILGRISGILAEDVEHYTALGYPITAKVGISGCELAFEKYLRGIDGEMLITEDAQGNIVSREITKEPVAGNDIYLTIDIFLQIASENALADNIQYVVDRAQTLPGKLDGEDCDAGAIVVQTATGGEILALGSYPTFDLATFNKDFSDLVNDPRHVYTNRALMGQYRPGSTAKIGMAVAALAEPLFLNGALFSTATTLNTKGIYTYYEDYQPECAYYTSYHRTHGTISISRAITVSCNWFFFDIGRVMGIDRINRYFSLFGMGQNTGIELGENVGILADAAYKQTLDLPASDRVWMPGDTLQTSIGVGYSEYTPLQISNYISMIINGGTRYAAHLLKEVKTFSGETVYTTEPQVLAQIEIGSEAHAAIKNGMQGVLSYSPELQKSFAGFPKSIGAGGKTGTAQTSSDVSNNAVFVSFAPLDEPEIVIACIIERGANGYNASWAARDVLDHYFGLTKEEQ